MGGGGGGGANFSGASFFSLCVYINGLGLGFRMCAYAQ